MNVGNRILTLVLAAGMAVGGAVQDADAQQRGFAQHGNGTVATQQYHQPRQNFGSVARMPQQRNQAQMGQQRYNYNYNYGRGGAQAGNQRFYQGQQMPRGQQQFGRGQQQFYPGQQRFANGQRGAMQNGQYAMGQRGAGMEAGRNGAGEFRTPQGSAQYRAPQGRESAIYNQVYSGARLGGDQMARTPIIMRSPDHQMYYWYPSTGAYGQIGDRGLIGGFDRGHWGGLGGFFPGQMYGWEVMTDFALVNDLMASEAWGAMLGGYPATVETPCAGPYGEPEVCEVPAPQPEAACPGPYGEPEPCAGPPVAYGYPYAYPPVVFYGGHRGMVRAAEAGAVITGVLGAIALSQ